MMGALGDAKDKASMADARTAYIAYELKSATGTPTTTDIINYMDKDAGSIKVAYKADSDGKITEFYYIDKNLDSSLTKKYVKIVMGDKAEIVDANFPEAGSGVTVLS